MAQSKGTELLDAILEENWISVLEIPRESLYFLLNPLTKQAEKLPNTYKGIKLTLDDAIEPGYVYLYQEV